MKVFKKTKRVLTCLCTLALLFLRGGAKDHGKDKGAQSFSLVPCIPCKAFPWPWAFPHKTSEAHGY